MILDPWRCSRPVVPKRLWGIRHYCRHNIPEESSSQKLFSFVRLLDSLLVYWLTYCMEQSPSWEANLFQLVKKSPAFYGTRRFITAFTSARHLSLSLANSIQSMPPHPTSWRSNLILSSIYSWVFQVVSFSQFSPLKPCIRLYSPCTCYMPHQSHSSRFDHPKNIGWGVQINKLLIM